MKKIIIASMLLSVAALASCTKEAQEDMPCGQEKLIFSATIGDLSKTTYNAGKVSWTAGDIIWINGVQYTATPDAEDPGKATFTSAGGSEAEAIGGKYYASYGFQANVSGSTVSGELSEAQSYGGAFAAPMYAESESTSLAFKNICSLFEISLKGSETVKSIELEADKAVSGAFTITAAGTAAPLTMGTDGSKTVTLDCGEGVTLTSEGVKFYIAAPAISYTNLTFKVRTADGRFWSKRSVKGAGIATEASKVYPLEFTPEFTNVLAKWLFSPTRTFEDGCGQTWCGQTSMGIYRYSLEPGERGYFNANEQGSGKLSYIQVDKTEWASSYPESAGLSILNTSNGGQPQMCGPMAGDCWQIETTGGHDLKAGDKIHVIYTYNPGNYGAKYWRMEYKDGGVWKPAFPTSTTTISKSGETVEYNLAFSTDQKIIEFTVTLENDNTDFVARQFCCSGYQVNDKYFAYPNVKCVSRIAGDPDNASKPTLEIDKL